MSEVVRVVIADDHEAVRSGIAAILATDASIEVVAEAEDGFEAVVACVKHAPDVALVDLRMPDRDGIWATERIVAETATKVLILTTYDSDDLVAQTLAAGAHGYLLKNTSGTELLIAIHHVAEDKHILDPQIAGQVISRFTALPEKEARNSLEKLTSREQQVLKLVAQGLTNQQIAQQLHLSVTTVKTHIGSLYHKTGAGSRVQLAQIAH